MGHTRPPDSGPAGPPIVPVKMADSARILIVDDDAGLVEALATALQFRYEVLTAPCGKAAFETLARCPVDLVVLEHRLPDMEGVALLQFLKQKFPLVLVIYMTAYGSEDLAVKFYDGGGRKYLRKPFKVSDLLGHVEKYLAAPRQTQGARTPILAGEAGGAPPQGNGAGDPRVAWATAYIEADLQNRLPVQDVARAAGLSKAQVNRVFKRAKGFTVERFIMRRRMANGIALLFDLRLSIKEVAALVGFTDAGNFARAFHKLTGYTPSELRHSLREKLTPCR